MLLQNGVTAITKWNGSFITEWGIMITQWGQILQNGATFSK